ncbi:MAG: hypothetical protein KBE41_04455 [Lutibacter sp.]|nr:hypothetical protein [Lutibacter sp.]MBP9600734.1 hypothetical protein [Lutibacter sp.]
MSSFISQQIHKFIKNWVNLKPISNEKASLFIKKELEKITPTMIARFGSNEIKAVLYPRMNVILRILLKNRIFVPMQFNAGFFPSNKETIKNFSKLMYEDIQQLDVLGSWRIEERFLVSHFKKAVVVQLDALEPYLQKDPWSEVLKDKKVLVIHPFNKTIEDQYYNKRELLFSDPRVLPKFKSLETIKAVQTIADNKSDFNNWFDALDYMKGEIDKKDFDIAIIGCGAYGFPLAAHVKRIGKKAIHLGGATQMLFGIKGKRWVDNPKFQHIINEHFVFPNENDKINNASKVEDGCYW